MGSLNFGTNVQPKASSGGDDLHKVFAVEQVEKKLAAAKIRLVLYLYNLFINIEYNSKLDNFIS